MKVELEMEMIFSPDKFTRRLFDQCDKVDNTPGEPDRWLDAVGKRIGRDLGFFVYKIHHDLTGFLFLEVGIFERSGSVVVVETGFGTASGKREIVPAFIGFYENSGTRMDMTLDEAKFAAFDLLRRRFYVDYTIEILPMEKNAMISTRQVGRDIFLSPNEYFVSKGSAFEPVPDSTTLGGLVYKMDLSRYGRC